MTSKLHKLTDAYDLTAPLERATMVPSAWYTDPRIYERERETVSAGSWQVVGRLDQLGEPGQSITAEIAEEPIVVARGADGQLRGFYNECRHHAAAVAMQPQGTAQRFRCP